MKLKNFSILFLHAVLWIFIPCKTCHTYDKLFLPARSYHRKKAQQNKLDLLLRIMNFYFKYCQL
jgi:hypothetical protein